LEQRADGQSEANTAIARIVRELDQSACLRPVSGDPAELRLWHDHDLASTAESRLGALIDPARLSEEERRDLLARATLDSEQPRARDAEYFKPYWIAQSSENAGTLAIATSLLGRSMLGVSSLYVAPAQRGRGHAARALDAVYAASLDAGLTGFRLSTDWSWQPAVRFYLKLGLWVWGWKRSLDFVRRRDLPCWRILVEGDHARFLVSEGNAERTLIEARRASDRLQWFETMSAERTSDDGLALYAPGTFALALAVRGFPLITSEKEWKAQLAAGFSDCGGPEGLAFKIRRFEAWDRGCGWLTPAPRIPGLDYPDWNEAD
jgi:GNAT superfamily N-acetyltransferase